MVFKKCQIASAQPPAGFNVLTSKRIFRNDCQDFWKYQKLIDIIFFK